MKKVLVFIRENAWTVAFAVVFIFNVLVVQRYERLNDDFKQNLTESCENRKASRNAYRFIIFTVAEGSPRQDEIVKYTEENLPPVEC